MAAIMRSRAVARSTDPSGEVRFKAAGLTTSLGKPEKPRALPGLACEQICDAVQRGGDASVVREPFARRFLDMFYVTGTGSGVSSITRAQFPF